ncbi:SPOR domain-containing protein [Phaeovulum vinaykumarii]|uniref:Sporulation related domain-containing protein n=1 Tax=Phaeovulum vinaykumarii TaxID=407234 RepID=A0A1N7L6Q5_9RHOB|nr:SPOR domain-containing protein [Phaeovulum vinaykumarii]SIS69473.1 Sporulation related domain-containing protein [Phaeovulum vinaykumarii]SOB99475.1 sporulation related protein [Phaeovulum vinaykumarii]
MQLGKVLSAIALAAALGAPLAPQGAWARGMDINTPAEIPPASYKGRQYVDSNGCVFVRGGYGNLVNWIPRVGRDRQQLCGYAPTLAQTPAAPAPATAAPAPRPATAAPAAARPDTTARTRMIAVPDTTRAARAPVVRAAPLAATPLLSLRAPRAAQAAQPAADAPYRRVTTALPAAPGGYVSPYVAPGWAGRRPATIWGHDRLPVIVSAATVDGRTTACPNLSPVAQRYMLSDGRHVVRCGPQTEDPVGALTRAGVAVGGIATARAAAAAMPPMPAGYRPAFKDDRLNPMRGVGTAAGDAQTARVWTDTVPMRMAAPPRTAAPAAAAPVATGVAPTAPVWLTPKTRISSKNAAQAPQPRAAQAARTGRLVQVGTFGVAENAQRSKARLRALGLPVASARVHQGGRDLQIVFAGPFADPAAASAALARARSAGFADALLR